MAVSQPAALALSVLLLAVAAPALCALSADELVAAAERVAESVSTGTAAEQWASIAVSGSAGQGGADRKTRRFSKRCGVTPPTQKQFDAVRPAIEAAVAKSVAEDVMRAMSGTESRLLVNSNFGPLVKTINVYWHVIQSSNTASQGNLSRDQINQQISVLNRMYRKCNFAFQLAAVDYTTKADWFTASQGSAADENMKRTLHQGGLQDLNVYSNSPRGTNGEQVAGYTKLPMFAKDDPQLDGSVILFGTLPGGRIYGMDMGMTLVHEAGHFLGLLHPFDNGCNVDLGGDQVGDTPYMANPLYDCTPQNSCPNVSGMDPIHNPMGYTPDSCMTQFTTMQCKKMLNEWYAFRN